jgi:ankyrin repeat protein
MASKKGHHEVVQLLIDAGADVLLSKANYKGYTPLHEAARKGEQDLAMRYVEMGADVNAPDIHGNRAAILAHAFGYPELAEKLGALNEEELAEAQKIQYIEDIKESAKQIAVDKAEAENRLVLKMETKSAAKAALDYYLKNLDSGKPYEELKAEAHKAAAECLANLVIAEKA